jgi:hypothetical protein
MNMHRLSLILLLSVAALAIPTTSWAAATSANLAINVTDAQAIAAVNLSNSSFTGGAPSGTVVGAINVTMSPASPAFSGTLSLSGTNASSFQIIGSNLETNGTVPAGTYNINIIAPETGASGSPFTQAETVSGTDPPTAGVEVPGPSQALFNNPYYTCVRNFYVSTTGSNSNNGTSPSTAWLTIANADTSSREAGDCINVAPGTYASGVDNIQNGGSSASSTGYVVYRCTTMNACTITDPNAGFYSTSTFPAYLIFDGFAFSASSIVSNASAIGCFNGNTGTVAACHHWWLINSIVTGYGQSGIQFNDGEYYYTLHNTIYGNAHACAYNGSNISYVTNKPASGYTPAADDTNNPKMDILGPGFPFHSMVAWNVIYNGYNGCSSGNTDGEAVIIDSNDTGNGNTVNYSGGFLVAFNVAYNNGGRCVQVFYSSYVNVANNSCYNNDLNTGDSGTGRPEYLAQESINGSTWFNNIAYAIPGSGVLDDNSGYVVGGYGADGTFNNNVSFCTATPANGNCEQNYNGNPAISCTANKCSPTNPLWVAVGNISSGSESTPPNGVNFALQSGSPAIGYGQTQSYLSAQSVDAGACYHTLTSCP